MLSGTGKADDLGLDRVGVEDEKPGLDSDEERLVARRLDLSIV